MSQSSSLQKESEYGEPEEARVVTIFPPEDGELDLAEYAPILLAQKDLELLKAGQAMEEVNVVIDDEVEDQVVELLGLHANLGFALEDMDLPFLVFHVKYLKRFFRFDVVVMDQQNEIYTISATNRQTLVRIKKHSCSLPISFVPGWNRICLDLRDVCARAFGVKFAKVTGIRVFANCRIWRLFFQAENYADDQLPSHLQVVEGFPN